LRATLLENAGWLRHTNDSAQQHAHAGLRAVVAGAQLIQLRDGFARVVGLAKLQIRFGQQIEILRLIRMLLNLLGELSKVQLRALLRGKRCAVVE